MLGRAALVFLLLGFALPGPARAEPTEAERMARWADLRHAIFGDRVVEEAGDLVAIDAPARAEDAAVVLKQAKELNVKAVFLGTNNWEAANLIEKAGAEAAEGVAFSTIFDPESGITMMTEAFLKAYRKKYGEDAVPESPVALGFDAYLIALDAISRAGTATDRELITAELLQTREFQGASGSITFDEKGDPIKSVVIKTVINGEMVSAYTVEPVWGAIEEEEEEGQ